ncbi:MAG TPA: hypothetical protein VD948_06035 [Rhodothermales bacterium]|nr:hypothetical protein [Rhodothermales bacterium]
MTAEQAEDVLSKVMRRAELLRQLRALAEVGDPEYAHSEADKLLVAYVNDAEIEAAYNAVEKWYA